MLLKLPPSFRVHHPSVKFSSRIGDCIFPALNSLPLLSEFHFLLPLQTIWGWIVNVPWQYSMPEAALRHFVFYVARRETTLALQENVSTYKLWAQLIKSCKADWVLWDMLTRKHVSFPCCIWHLSRDELSRGDSRVSLAPILHFRFRLSVYRRHHYILNWMQQVSRFPFPL